MSSSCIDSINLAYSIINKGRYKDLTHLKLQKLIYYIQSWHLVFRGEKLFEDDFEAWVHGPVSRKVWDHFKKHIYETIPPDESKTIRLEDYLNSEQIEIIEDVLEEYGDKTAYHLECLTHSEDPWAEARKGYPSFIYCDNKISEDTIKKYYTELLGQNVA